MEWRAEPKFSWGNFLVHWISAWVVIVLLATAYEAVTKTGRFIDHPEATGRLAVSVAFTMGVVSYFLQKKSSSRPAAVLMFVVYCGLRVWSIEAERSHAIGVKQAAFFGMCGKQCQGEERRCQRRCDCMWREIRKAYPDNEDLDELEKRVTSEEARDKAVVFNATCAAAIP